MSDQPKRIDARQEPFLSPTRLVEMVVAAEVRVGASCEVAVTPSQWEGVVGNLLFRDRVAGLEAVKTGRLEYPLLGVRRTVVLVWTEPSGS